MIMIMILDHFYSATLSTTTQRRSRLQQVSRRRAQATISEGLAQSPHMAARVGVEPTIFRLKVIDSTKRHHALHIYICVTVLRRNNSFYRVDFGSFSQAAYYSQHLKIRSILISLANA